MNFRVFCTIIFSSLLFSITNAQVVINEFSAANFSNHSDTFGDFEDWIELYNNSNVDFDLSGYFLSDKDSNPTKWEITAGTIIPAWETKIFYCSGRADYFPNADHTNFKITQTKNSEDIVFADPSGNIIDIHEIDDNNQKNHSFGRRIDGGTDWGIYENPTPGDYNSNSTSFGDYAPKPDLDTIPGFYNGPLTITVSENNTNIVMFYTLDGSTPSQTSTPIANGETITLTQTTVVKVRSFHIDTDTLPSFVKTSTFFIDENITIPTVSISGDEELADLLDGGWGGWNDPDPEGFFEFFNADGEYEDEAYGDFNKHGNDSWAYDQRGVDFVCRDEFGYDYAVKEKFFKPYSERNKFQRIILKAAASDNYSFEDGAHIRDSYIQMMSVRGELELDERKHLSCIMFLNGEYWGVYEIREKIDDPDFTEYYFDQGKYDLDFLKTWGGTVEEYGSRDDWDDLVDFVDNNDMSIDANYDIVEEQFNILSFIDYFLVNTHTVCVDWLNYNTGWWRGRNPDGEAQKWRYILWDMDATFGHYVNFTNVPNTSADADPCSMEELDSDFEGHTFIVTKLQDNPRFFDLYINRYADLNNSLFNCDTMIAILDEYVAVIDPEMNRQCVKWGGTYNGWLGQVQVLRDFILDRCAIIDSAIVDCYDVEGPFPVTVIIEPAGTANQVQLNTLTPSTYPFVGDYFTGVDFNLEALAADGYLFVEWQINNNALIGNSTDSIAAMNFTTGPDTIYAFFEPEILVADTRLTIVVEPPEAGTITLNSTALTAYPHLQFYFDATPINLIVTPSSSNFEFLNWQTNAHNLSPNTTSTNVNFVLMQNDIVVAHFNDLNAPITNIENIKMLEGISIYPNPVKDVLNVKYPETLNLDFTILDINGQVIVKNKLNGNKINIAALNIPKGNYIVRFADKKAFNYQQFIVY